MPSTDKDEDRKINAFAMLIRTDTVEHFFGSSYLLPKDAGKHRDGRRGKTPRNARPGDWVYLTDSNNFLARVRYVGFERRESRPAHVPDKKTGERIDAGVGRVIVVDPATWEHVDKKDSTKGMSYRYLRVDAIGRIKQIKVDG